MAKKTQLVRDDAYEELGAAYQCVQIAALDAALRENGVSRAAARRKVCESFLSAMGSLHDQGWFKPAEAAEGEPVYPLLCFSRRFLNADTPVGELGPVYAPSPSFAYHEYALGSVDAFYEGNPAARVETGTFEGEGD